MTYTTAWRDIKITIAIIAAAIAIAVVISKAQNGGFASNDPCIILALGGNKLCGSDAAAWCRATDPSRRAFSPGSSSASDCQSIEDQYPQ